MNAPLRPLCRCCAQPIPKRTKTIWFGQGRDRDDATWVSERAARPASKAEAQTFSNLPIVHLTRAIDGSVSRVSVWDGESYIDPHFCKGDCAARFGRMAATHHPEIATAAYALAMRQREERGFG